MRRLVVIPVVAVTVAMVWAPAAVAQDPVIAAAGDIACAPGDPVTATSCRHGATSNLLVGAPIAAVLPLGDIQYRSASLSDIMGVGAYNDTWGRVKAISRPVLGNHEFSGTGYFDYFNGPGVTDGPAGPRPTGYYSFEVGSWHLVALNSNCARVACSPGSEQEQWLRADLAAHPTTCTLAYWHHPRYSSGHDGSNTFMQPLWEALHDAGAEIVLSGHSHDYERFAPLDRNGNLDPARGIRQFVVGTGGAFFTGLGSLMGHSEVAQNDTFGVLFLTLHASSYDWRFVPEAGRTFTDSGSGSCHGPLPPPPPPPGPPPPPPPPADVTAPVISGLRASPGRFGVGREHAAAVKRGTTFHYQLSEAAKVGVAISRRSGGRRVRGKCRRRARANRGRPRCILYREVGRFTQHGAAGSNARRFRGRIGGRRLIPGEFRAGFIATDVAGNRSQRKRVGFTIVRARPRLGPR
jgi:hypothetical protein